VEELVWKTAMVLWVLGMSEFTTVHVDAPGLLRSSIGNMALIKASQRMASQG
jgi:hypothetical protein